MMTNTAPFFRADLHCHTTCSDGSMPVDEIIKLAVEIGLKGLSITDHDTIDAYPMAEQWARDASLALIPGVELSAVHRGTSIHILGYSFSINSPAMISFCSQHQTRRLARMTEMLHLLNKHGMPLSEEELYASRGTNRGIGRPHLAQAMVKKGYAKDVNEAFKRYLAEGRPCYASGKPNSVEETLACIKEARGIAVLAHPHLIDNTGVLKDLLSMPFDGMECFYARFSKAQNQRWINIAETRGWLISGGSDFHGAIKPTIPLGCSWTNEETFQRLLDHYQSHQRAADKK
jgi:predicted metal-dependent phosphoesterase TrpH